MQSYGDDPLWQGLRDFQLDDGAAQLSFTDRLARENGWDFEYSLRAVGEYKRFLYLICKATHPLTPSDQVDQVWHLHLIYTRSYWIDLCEGVLGRQVHHGPTKGGQAEQAKFNDWYAETLALYAETFGHAAPQDIWPSGKERFSDIHFRRVNLRRNWIIPKPKF